VEGLQLLACLLLLLRIDFIRPSIWPILLAVHVYCICNIMPPHYMYGRTSIVAVLYSEDDSEAGFFSCP
jgi:hypothetical protein